MFNTYQRIPRITEPPGVYVDLIMEDRETGCVYISGTIQMDRPIRDKRHSKSWSFTLDKNGNVCRAGWFYGCVRNAAYHTGLPKKVIAAGLKVWRAQNG